MKTTTVLKNASSADCGCCHLGTDSLEGVYGCLERSVILTPREQAVLARIRETGARAREIKQQLRGSHEEDRGGLSLRDGIQEQLEELRRVRTALEGERIAAAEERMRYLGHL